MSVDGWCRKGPEGRTYPMTFARLGVLDAGSYSPCARGQGERYANPRPPCHDRPVVRRASHGVRAGSAPIQRSFAAATGVAAVAASAATAPAGRRASPSADGPSASPSQRRPASAATGREPAAGSARRERDHAVSRAALRVAASQRRCAVRSQRALPSAVPGQHDAAVSGQRSVSRRAAQPAGRLRLHPQPALRR